MQNNCIMLKTKLVSTGNIKQISEIMESNGTCRQEEYIDFLIIFPVCSLEQITYISFYAIFILNKIVDKARINVK